MGNSESEPSHTITQQYFNQKYRVTYHNHPNAHELLRIFRLFSKDPFPFIQSIDLETEKNSCCDRPILKVTTPHHPFNLETLLNMKRRTKGFLVEKSIINILAFMQVNGIVYGVFNPNFFHLEKGRFLTAEVLHLLPGNHHQNNYSLHNYYSPQKIKNISNDNFQEKQINLYKSQVFSFALLILQVATAPLSKPKFHKSNLKQLIWSQIGARLQVVQQRYSQRLYQFLEMILREDVRIRPDWTYLRIWMARNEPTLDVAPCIFWSI